MNTKKPDCVKQFNPCTSCKYCESAVYTACPTCGSCKTRYVCEKHNFEFAPLTTGEYTCDDWREDLYDHNQS